MENRISILIKAVNNSFVRILNKDIEELDLTSSQCNVLGFLCANQNEEINPVDIEKHCHLTKPTVSGILKRLYEKGFIEVIQSQKDNRYKQIKLSNKALEHKNEMDKKITAVEEVLLKDISEEEKQFMILILNKMFNNLKNYSD